MLAVLVWSDIQIWWRIRTMLIGLCSLEGYARILHNELSDHFLSLLIGQYA
jgi:hypothetical protein